MQYKTIALELLQVRPALHRHLSANGNFLSELQRQGEELKRLHLAVLSDLNEKHPEISEPQRQSQALEIAVEQYQQQLDAQAALIDQP